MNNLEQQIASLRVSEPSAELDARVDAALSSCPLALPASEERASIRFPAVATIAAACLLTGAIAGFAGASLDASTRSDSLPMGGPLTLANGTPATQPDPRPISALLTAHLVDYRFDQCQRCHLASDQVAARLQELRQSARVQAAAWERRTGETFLLASHVEDARFVECRQCHIPGGQVKSM